MAYQTLTGPNDKIGDDMDTPIIGDEDTETFEGDGETTDSDIEAQYEQYAYGQEAALGNAHILY
jgi:hypothetical protein